MTYSLRPRDHITDATIKLRWLPIRAWIDFELCLSVYRALKGQSPSYVAELVQPITARHSGLQSSNNNTFLVPQTSLKFGERLSVLLVPQLETAFQQTFAQPEEAGQLLL